MEKFVPLESLEILLHRFCQKKFFAKLAVNFYNFDYKIIFIEESKYFADIDTDLIQTSQLCFFKHLEFITIFLRFYNL